MRVRRFNGQRYRQIASNVKPGDNTWDMAKEEGLLIKEDPEFKGLYIVWEPIPDSEPAFNTGYLGRPTEYSVLQYIKGGHRWGPGETQYTVSFTWDPRAKLWSVMLTDDESFTTYYETGRGKTLLKAMLNAVRRAG